MSDGGNGRIIGGLRLAITAVIVGTIVSYFDKVDDTISSFASLSQRSSLSTPKNNGGIVVPDFVFPQPEIADHVDRFDFIFPQPDRLVAIGDLHGDLDATRTVLQIAGVLNSANDTWIGGKSVVVQVGDQLDRGDDELEILALLQRLSIQAQKAGGALHVLAGNHETMTAERSLQYASSGAEDRFMHVSEACTKQHHSESAYCKLSTQNDGCGLVDPSCAKVPSSIDPSQRSRFLALRSGGFLARELLSRERLAAIIIGDTVFIHAGLTDRVLPPHLDGAHALQQLNTDLRALFAGRPAADAAPSGGGGRARREALHDAVWSRTFSSPPPAQLGPNTHECHHLSGMLARLPAATAAAAAADDRAGGQNGQSAPAADTAHGGGVSPSAAAAAAGGARSAGGARVRRMVVGHTVQKNGISAACGGAVWRVDVGMSAGVRGGAPQALEILPSGRISVISAGGWREIVEAGGGGGDSSSSSGRGGDGGTG